MGVRGIKELMNSLSASPHRLSPQTPLSVFVSLSLSFPGPSARVFLTLPLEVMHGSTDSLPAEGGGGARGRLDRAARDLRSLLQSSPRAIEKVLLAEGPSSQRC